ncbi:MAG: radical SAM protein [Chloroflexota bacterium]|nr:radical SAM protein [Chloroflexota bacterium]
MQNIIQNIKGLFSKKEPLPSGIYRYQTPPDAEEQYRLHLRIEPDGRGLLVINASTVLHLNQTAVEYAYHIIKETDPNQVAEEISNRYQVDHESARKDFDAFYEKVMTLIKTPDLDPVTYLGIERQQPYSGHISAPYRLDCALTYRVGQGSLQEHAPVDRVDRELSTEEWMAILRKTYDVGIPHVLLTGGEPTLREDLPKILAYAEDLGLVTGLLTDGLKFQEEDFLNDMLVKGLDHLMIILDPKNQGQWQALEKVLPEDLFTTVHLTYTGEENLQAHIQRLAEMGANALSLSTPNQDLEEKLQDLRNFAAMQGLELVWDIPVPYSRNNPVTLELEGEGYDQAPEGAGKAWLYVEPDGDVLPAQGLYDQVLGNMLRDPWEEIWEK